FAYSRPLPNVPEAVITGFERARPRLWPGRTSTLRLGTSSMYAPRWTKTTARGRTGRVRFVRVQRCLTRGVRRMVGRASDLRLHGWGLEAREGTTLWIRAYDGGRGGARGCGRDRDYG